MIFPILLFAFAILLLVIWFLKGKRAAALRAQVHESATRIWNPIKMMAHDHRGLPNRWVDGVMIPDYSKCRACVARSQAQKEDGQVSGAARKEIRKIRWLRIGLLVIAAGSMVGGIVLLAT